MNLDNFTHLLSFSQFGLNWIDFLIITALIFYIIEGISLGFIRAVLDLISFALSFLLGLSFYSFFGKLLTYYFLIPHGFANAIGFFIVAFLSEIFISFLAKIIISSFPIFDQLTTNLSFFKLLDKILGGAASLLSGLFLTSFILTLIVALPFSGFLKNSVSSSRVGSLLTSNTQGLAKSINNVFGGAVDESLSFLTIEPKSNELVNLNFKTNDFTIDKNSEQEMFALVNQERSLRGVPNLTFDNALAAVGESHCEDMFKRGYFSHYTPEGISPFDRMAQANISFTSAGENLALAPNVKLAMQGLMQSPGHRANILNYSFGKVGIGVVNGGIYGEMFCQEFTN
jgi:uncharacterized protein YkwD